MNFDVTPHGYLWITINKEPFMTQPPLRNLHAETILSQPKLEGFRRLATADLIDSLTPGQPGALKARPDGTIMDGHHRILVLRERGFDVDNLPREVLPHEGPQ